MNATHMDSRSLCLHAIVDARLGWNPGTSIPNRPAWDRQPDSEHTLAPWRLSVARCVVSFASPLRRTVVFSVERSAKSPSGFDRRAQRALRSVRPRWLLAAARRGCVGVPYATRPGARLCACHFVPVLGGRSRHDFDWGKNLEDWGDW